MKVERDQSQTIDSDDSDTSLALLHVCDTERKVQRWGYCRWRNSWLEKTSQRPDPTPPHRSQLHWWLGKLWCVQRPHLLRSRLSQIPFVWIRLGNGQATLETASPTLGMKWCSISHTHIYIYIQYNIYLYTVYYIHILYTILYHTNSYSIVTWYKYFWQGPHTQVLTLDARAHQRNPLRNVQSYILPQEHLDSVQSWVKLSFKTKDKRSIAYCQWDEPHWEVIYSSITIWLYFTAWLHDTTWASSAEAMVQGATESPLMIHFP